MARIILPKKRRSRTGLLDNLSKGFIRRTVLTKDERGKDVYRKELFVVHFNKAIPKNHPWMRG